MSDHSGSTDANKGGLVSDTETLPGGARKVSPHDATLAASVSGATPAPSPFTSGRDLTGTVFGDYRLERKLAEGGMGEVYVATQIKLDRRVAFKVLSDRLASRSEFIQRFEREAKSIAALNHPNVVQVHDYGHLQGHYYLVMELVEGQDMSDYLLAQGKLPLIEGLDVIEQAAQALKAARDKSIIHRDIKPANLLRTKDGRIKVSDLGLAKKLTEESDMTATGVGIGSPHFLAPEQADDARNVDHRADIYSLGITLLYLLTGKRPYDGTSAFSVVMAHASKPLPSGAELGTDLPDNVEALIRRMSAKKPEERHQDYEALLADLARVKAGHAPARTWADMWGDLRHGSVFKWAAALALVTVAAWVVLQIKQSMDATSQAIEQQAKMGSSGPVESQLSRGGDFSPPPPGRGNDESFAGKGGRKGGYNEPPPGGGRFILPRKPPPNFNPVEDGPPEKMMADADAYVKKNPDKYIDAIHAYELVATKARGTALQVEASRRLGNAMLAHDLVVHDEITKRTEQMKSKLAENNPQAAWEVWKSFPPNLRIPEVDDQIRFVLEAEMPPDFRPK